MRKIRFILFVFILLTVNAYAAQINSTSYKQIVIVSSGGDNVNGSSYKTYTAIGMINRIINSTSYLNKLGFFYTWLLANDQPCSQDSQCEGGFCCSNLCSSSSCPSAPSPSRTTGGGAGGGGGGAGGGNIYVCSQEWKCGEWGDCSNGFQERQCELVKVAQHAQTEPCQSIDNPQKTSRECRVQFSVSPSSIKEHLKLGTSKIQKIKIKNSDNVPINFDLSAKTINEFIFLSSTSFTLEPSEEKEIEVNIVGRKLGSYFGSLEIIGDNIKEVVNIVIEVESEQVLFDAKIDIPSAFKSVAPGSELRAQITLLNVGPPRKVDVTTTFIIKDRRGNVVYESSETFAVEKQKSFVKSFKIPPNLQPDDYLAVIEVRYENSFAVSSDLFKVVKKETQLTKKLTSNQILLAMLFIFVAILALITFILVSKKISKTS